MAQTELTFENKNNPIAVVNRASQATAEDFNEIKEVVNANAEDAEARISSLDTAVSLNTAKVGITPEQASEIATNTGKVSYTDGAAVALNTEKVGITSEQASEITVNSEKSPGGLIPVTESTNIGLRRVDTNPNNHGNIGSLAIDLSYSSSASSSNGATALYAYAEGHNTEASGGGSHAEGSFSKATGVGAHAEGTSTVASGEDSHAEGRTTVASGDKSHAEGQNTTASGSSSHSEGFVTQAVGSNSHAQNIGTIAGYTNQTAMGSYNENKSENILEVGNGTSSVKSNAFEVSFQGSPNIPAGEAYNIGGVPLNTGGLIKITEDSKTGFRVADSNPANYGDIGEGAIDLSRSTSESSIRGATGLNSYAEGLDTIASGSYSHAEGSLTVAEGRYSHAEGSIAKALGDHSHSEGLETEASGESSHAEGRNSVASGENSHAQNRNTIAAFQNQTAIGQCNENKSENILEVGNGVDVNNRSNALELSLAGALKTKSNLIEFSVLTPQNVAPSTPVMGTVYVDVDTHMYFYNGTIWKQLDN